MMDYSQRLTAESEDGYVFESEEFKSMQDCCVGTWEEECVEKLCILEHEIEAGILAKVVTCYQCKHSRPLFDIDGITQTGCVCSYDDEVRKNIDFCSGGEKNEVVNHR